MFRCCFHVGIPLHSRSLVPSGRFLYRPVGFCTVQSVLEEDQKKDKFEF
ncbi:hypothetical protein PSE_4032 [Pseudovibrio sp. FO-BEG1]|nr:hypothetical protein PSE_4032 [Pseudovibrio sp. FO-BEG1]